MILGLVMYLLVEDTGNIRAQCLDIMKGRQEKAQRQARKGSKTAKNRLKGSQE
jgi:hypothetical protein